MVLSTVPGIGTGTVIDTGDAGTCCRTTVHPATRSYISIPASASAYNTMQTQCASRIVDGEQVCLGRGEGLFFLCTRLRP